MDANVAPALATGGRRSKHISAAGLIAVADAAALLDEWAGKHRFKLKIASFAEVV